MLYSINEYKGEIKTPTDFPTEDPATDEYLSILHYPYGVATRYAFELNCGDKFREYSKLITRPAKYDIFKSILDKCDKANVEVSSPEYIYTYKDRVCYVFFNKLSGSPINKCTTVQTKYYLYFKSRYPKCSMFNDGNNNSHIFVKENGKLVGGFMPFETRIDVYV